MENTLFQGDVNPDARADNGVEAAAAPAAAAAPEIDERRTALEQRCGELQEQLLRKQAEFENFRKRTEREKGDLRAAVTMATVENFLPVLDGLERAVAHIPPDEAARDYHKGVELVHKQFREILERLGVLPIEAAGKQFDPTIHHAVEMVRTGDYEDHTVIEEYQRGYTLNDRLIRPAMVRVAVKD